MKTKLNQTVASTPEQWNMFGVGPVGGIDGSMKYHDPVSLSR